MFESERHDLLWQMWVSNPFQEMDFEEFKNKAIKNVREKSKSKAEKEAEAVDGMTKALDLLGGDFVGN